MTPSTACIKALRACVLGAARAGLSPAEVAGRLEFDPAILADASVRVPHALFLRAWEEVPARAGDANFGLSTAEQMAGMPFDVVDYVCAQGPADNAMARGDKAGAGSERQARGVPERRP